MFRYSSLSSYVNAIHLVCGSVLCHAAIILPISFLEHTLFCNNETVSRNLVVRSWYIFNWRTPLKNESMMKDYLVLKEKKKWKGNESGLWHAIYLMQGHPRIVEKCWKYARNHCGGLVARLVMKHCHFTFGKSCEAHYGVWQ